MTKRTLKPAAGESRVSLEEATSAARVVYRDGTTGRFVILDGDKSGRFRDTAGRTRAKDGFKVRKDSASSLGTPRGASKKR